MSLSRWLCCTVAVALLSCGEPPRTVHELTVSLSMNLPSQAAAAKVYTKDQPVTFKASVTGGTPERISLYRGNEKVGDFTLTDYTFDTNLLPEGVYEFTARAELELLTFASEVRTVVVDRTPPKVVETLRSPKPGATNVSVREVIGLVFDEEVDKTTVNSSTAKVLVGGADQNAIVEVDGGIVLRLRPSTAAPFPPGNFAVTLSGQIKDPAGNALTLPTTSWTWNAPVWQLLGSVEVVTTAGTSTTWSQLVVDKAGDPQVAWLEQDGSGGMRVGVASWDGTKMRVLGESLGPAVDSTTASNVTLSVDDQHFPTVAYVTNGHEIEISKWNATSWGSIGHVKGNDTGNSQHPKFDGAITLAPVLTFEDNGGSGGGVDVFSYIYDGSAWNAQGDPIGKDSAENFVQPCVSVVDGKTVLAYGQSAAAAYGINVQILDDGWKPYSGGPLGTTAYNCQIRHNGSKEAVIAYQQSGVHVSRHAAARDGGYSALGAVDGSGVNPSLTLRNNNPVVAVESGGNVIVKEYTGSWTQIGTSFAGRYPSVGVHGDQVFVSASVDPGGGTRKTNVYRHNK